MSGFGSESCSPQPARFGQFLSWCVGHPTVIESTGKRLGEAREMWSFLGGRVQGRELLVLVILPFCCVWIVASAIYSDTQRRALRAEAHDAAHNVTKLVDKELDRYRLALQVLSSSPNLASGDFTRFYGEAKQLTEIAAGVGAALVKSNGEIVFRTAFPIGAVVPPGDRNASLVAAEREALQTHKMTVSGLFYGREIEEPSVTLVQPIMKDGTVVYLLTLRIPATDISAVLSSQKRSPAWLFAVVGTDDVIIARSWAGEQYVGRKSSTALLAHTQDMSGSFYSTREGARVYNVYVKSPVTGWRIVVAVPVSFLRAPYYHSMIVVALALASAVLISLILASLSDDITTAETGPRLTWRQMFSTGRLALLNKFSLRAKRQADGRQP
jgi:hypothetical protein